MQIFHGSLVKCHLSTSTSDILSAHELARLDFRLGQHKCCLCLAGEPPFRMRAGKTQRGHTQLCNTGKRKQLLKKINAKLRQSKRFRHECRSEERTPWVTGCLKNRKIKNVRLLLKKSVSSLPLHYKHHYFHLPTHSPTQVTSKKRWHPHNFWNATAHNNSWNPLTVANSWYLPIWEYSWVDFFLKLVICAAAAS